MPKTNNLDWDLENLLNNQPFEKLHKDWLTNQNLLIKLYDQGNCFKEKQTFKNYLIQNLAFAKISNRIWNYVENKINENVNDSLWNGWQQQMQIEMQKFDVHFANESQLIIKYKNKIQSFLNSKDLIQYKRVFDLEFQNKPYLLSKNLEVLISKLSLAGPDVEEIYQTLVTSDIKFKPALDSKNKQHQIYSETLMPKILKSKDRVLRKNAWNSLQETYLAHQNVISKLLYYNYLDSNISSQIRNFKDFLHAQAYNDEISINFIDFVYNQVSNYSSSFNNFYKLSNQALKKKYSLKKVYPWDQNLSLFKMKEKFLPNEAKEIVLEALKSLGKNYLVRVNKAFNERWISWLPKENKQTGAYSVGGILGLNKFYILLNYDDTLDSVFSLIHELGHSIHSSYLVENQTIYCETDIFCAEIASTTNEMLLNFYLIKKFKNNPKKLVTIYQEIISNFFSTTTSQIMLSDFEYQFIQKINNKDLINSQTVFEMYAKTFCKYLNTSKKQYQNVIKNKKFKRLTAVLRVDHFFMKSFYVYKYAVSIVVALNVANKIFLNDHNMLNIYLKFLTLGSSQPPLELIKFLGFDVTKPDCWNQAINIINTFILEYKKLLKKLKLLK